jgi:hypothetical protein
MNVRLVGEVYCDLRTAHKLLRLKTPCSASQAFVIPTPLAIVLAMCQGPLRLLRAGSLVFSGRSMPEGSEDACEQFQRRSDRWTCSSRCPTIRRFPSQARSPSRSCFHLVLVLLKVSFGILICKRYLSRTGDWSNVDGTPITQCP